MKTITAKVEKETSPLMTLGKLGILAAGGYILWTNRFKVQRFLEAQGISTPWMNSNVGEAIASGAAKFTGSLQNEVKSFTQPNSLSNVAKSAEKSAQI